MCNNRAVLQFKIVMLSVISWEHLSVLRAMQTGNSTNQRSGIDDNVKHANAVMLMYPNMYCSGGLM
jgi:hypothetical protein